MVVPLCIILVLAIVAIIVRDVSNKKKVDNSQPSPTVQTNPVGEMQPTPGSDGLTPNAQNAQTPDQGKRNNRIVEAIIVVVVLILCAISTWYAITELNKPSDGYDGNAITHNNTPTYEYKEDEPSGNNQDEPVNEETTEDDSDKRYFAIEKWGIKFAYPDGVTEMETNFDEGAWGDPEHTQAFVIYSITYNSEKYNSVSICGWENTNMRTLVLGNVYKIDSTLGEKNVYNGTQDSDKATKLIGVGTNSYYKVIETATCSDGTLDTAKAQTAAKLADEFLSSVRKL